MSAAFFQGWLPAPRPLLDRHLVLEPWSEFSCEGLA